VSAGLHGNECDCKSGYVWNSNFTECVAERSADLCGDVVCGENMECVDAGFMGGMECECLENYYMDADGNCMSEEDMCKGMDCGQGTCVVDEFGGGPGQPPSLEPVCDCFKDYVFDGTTCVEDTGQIFCDDNYDCMQPCQNSNATCDSGICNCG